MKSLILATLLSFMVATESTVIKYVKQKEKSDIPSEQLVLLVELFKLSVCAIAVLVENKVKEKRNRPVQGETEGDALLRRIERDAQENEGNSSSILWFLVPAFLYAVSNNVTFAALALMSPALFNLLMNLKIPMTALMAWAFLGFEINTRLAISFLALFCGTAIATLRFSAIGEITLDGSFYGLILMFIYSACSAGAAVYTEYVTKMRFKQESMFVQNVKFCICSAVANIVLILLRGELPYTTIRPLHLLSVLALAGNGLVTAAVLKYGGSILKTYAVSVAMFISAFFTWIFFNHALSWNFYFGAGICAVAVNLYAYEKYRRTF